MTQRCLATGASLFLLAASCNHGGDAAPPAPSVLSAPSALRASAGSPTTVELAWADNSDDEKGFTIERGTAAFVEIATVAADVTSFTDGGLAPRGAYSYRVRAFRDAGKSAYSDVAFATLPSPPAPTLAAVVPASAFAPGGGAAHLIGSGFAAYAPGPSTVMFGTTPAGSVVVQRDEALTCVVPESAPGRVDVAVQNANGGARRAGAFTYYPWPPRLLDPDVRLDGDAPGAADSTQPWLCADAGAVYAVWSDRRNGSSDIHARCSADGGATWSPDRRIDTDAAGAAASEQPRACCSGSSLYVVWQDRRNGPHEIRFNRSLDGGATWLPSDVRLNTTPAGSATARDPEICADGARVYVTWRDQRNGASDVYFNRSIDGGATWLARDVRLDTDPAGAASSELPRIAARGDEVHVVWQDARNGATDLYTNASSDGGATWRAADTRIDSDAPGAADSLLVCVCMAGSRVYAAWQDARDGAFDVRFSHSSDGGATWAADARLDTDPAGAADSTDVQLACTGEAVYAVWTDRRDGTGEVWCARSRNGGASWEHDLRIDAGAPGSADSDHPRIAVSGDNVCAAWDRGAGTYCDIWLNSSHDGGATWQPTPLRVERDAPGAGDSDDAHVACNDAELYVLWSDRRNGASDIYFSRDVY